MRSIFLLLLALGTQTALAAHDCRFSAERRLDLDAAGLKTLLLNLHSSDLHAQGVPGLHQIEVRGKACASDESWLADLDLEHRRSGDRETVAPKKEGAFSHFSLFGSSYAYIDIELRVPAELPLEIQTGSGDAKISGLAALNFDSGSGDLQVDHVAGAVGVRLGSGDVIADDVGSLHVERSGSGDVRAHGVHGDVVVGSVGSGDLTFRDVQGGVRADSIGSGDVVADRVGGDVVIGSIGSGDVNVDGVGGAFVVHHAGSSDIRHHNVSGKIDLPRRHGD